MDSNLSQLPSNTNSKIKETFKQNLRFFKSVLYLTKKIFMI